ncbi:rimJ [Klebsiella pneumoniae]|nr:rimJ [Klebsiella pneumoniae]
MEISGKTTKKPSTTSMLSTNRKYLPRLLACETRDISPPGKNRDKRGYSAGNLLLFPAPLRQYFFIKKQDRLSLFIEKRRWRRKWYVAVFTLSCRKGIVMKARVKSGGLKKEMFGYRSNVPKVRLTTDRLVVRLVHDRDAWRLADYYAENKAFLKPWEPVRDDSHCYPSGWQARLSMIAEFHKQGSAFYFALLDPEEKEIIGVANFSNVVRGSFHACYLGYSIGEKWQGQGLMFEALTSAIRYMQRTQHIHRIMANYMPHNQRSGALLARLGFEKEGYAKDYLLIDGQWRDHVLTALTTPDWSAGR